YAVHYTPSIYYTGHKYPKLCIPADRQHADRRRSDKETYRVYKISACCCRSLLYIFPGRASIFSTAAQWIESRIPYMPKGWAAKIQNERMESQKRAGNGTGWAIIAATLCCPGP